MACDMSMIDMEPRNSGAPLPTCMAMGMCPTIPDASLFSNGPPSIYSNGGNNGNQNWLPPAHLIMAEKQTSAEVVQSPRPNTSQLPADLVELFQAQNKQLQVLQQQVEKILSYQEHLQNSPSSQPYSSPKSDSYTQTSHIEPFPSVSASQTAQKNSVGIMTSFASPKLLPQARIPSNATPRTANSSPKSAPRSTCPEPETTRPATELSLNFRDLHLETIHEQPTTPQESLLQINMQEYPESPCQSVNKPDFSLHSQDAKHIYGNLLDQVKKLLSQGTNVEDFPVQNYTPEMDARMQEYPKEARIPHKDSVRAATLRRIQDLGVSFVALPTCLPNNPEFDSVYIPQVRAPVFYGDDNGSDESPDMDHLIQKYLHRNPPLLESPAIRKGFGPKETDFSMATAQYLQRYGLTEAEIDREIPRTTAGNAMPQHSFATRQFLARYQLLEETVCEASSSPVRAHQNVVRTRFSAQETLKMGQMQRNWPSNPENVNFAQTYQPDRVLDMTMLKQQPKLL